MYYTRSNWTPPHSLEFLTPGTSDLIPAASSSPEILRPFSAVCLTVFLFEFWPRTYTIESFGKSLPDLRLWFQSAVFILTRVRTSKSNQFCIVIQTKCSTRKELSTTQKPCLTIAQFAWNCSGRTYLCDLFNVFGVSRCNSWSFWYGCCNGGISTSSSPMPVCTKK